MEGTDPPLAQPLRKYYIQKADFSAQEERKGEKYGWKKGREREENVSSCQLRERGREEKKDKKSCQVPLLLRE